MTQLSRRILAVNVCSVFMGEFYSLAQVTGPSALHPFLCAPLGSRCAGCNRVHGGNDADRLTGSARIAAQLL